MLEQSVPSREDEAETMSDLSVLTRQDEAATMSNECVDEQVIYLRKYSLTPTYL